MSVAGGGAPVSGGLFRPGEDGATERSDGGDGGDSNATALSSLARLQLDRQTLEQLGLSHETVATLYRTLYVFTVGFHEHVSNVLDSSTGNQELVSRMWRAYSVMAEELSGQSVETELEEAMVSDSTLLRAVGRRFGADGCAPLFVSSTPCCSKPKTSSHPNVASIHTVQKLAM